MSKLSAVKDIHMKNVTFCKKKSIERQPYLDMLYFPLCKNDLLHLDYKDSKYADKQ